MTPNLMPTLAKMQPECQNFRQRYRCVMHVMANIALNPSVELKQLYQGTLCDIGKHYRVV